MCLRLLILLAEQVYVPLFRAKDDSIDPILGDPVASPVSKVDAKRTTMLSPRSPMKPEIKLRAYAGPMSPEEVPKLQNNKTDCLRRIKTSAIIKLLIAMFVLIGEMKCTFIVILIV